MDGMSNIWLITLTLCESVLGLRDHTKHGSGLQELHQSPRLDNGGADGQNAVRESGRISSHTVAHFPKSVLSRGNVFYLMEGRALKLHD